MTLKTKKTTTCPECKRRNGFFKGEQHELVSIKDNVYVMCCWNCGTLFGTIKGYDADIKATAQDSLNKFKKAVLEGLDK